MQPNKFKKKKMLNSFPNWYHFILPSVMYDSSSFSTLYQLLLLSVFLILILVVVVFHYGFNNNGEQLFICFLTICVSLVKCQVFCPLFVGLSLLFSFRNSKKYCGASLVVQWFRVLLPMQATQVQTMVWEDPTCCRATKPGHHNY